MAKIILSKPVLICLYGFPGSGKSFVARNLAEHMKIAYISSDQLRSELFAKPRYDTQENAIISHLMRYMCEEFLGAGLSVVYDGSTQRGIQRRKLRELAARHGASYLLVWLQIDAQSAFGRTQHRDRRTIDDKFAQPLSQQSFNHQLSEMQNPKDEQYLVISGKHAFGTQKSAIVNRLYQIGLVTSDSVQGNVTKPGLINLVPNRYVEQTPIGRRNIAIG